MNIQGYIDRLWDAQERVDTVPNATMEVVRQNQTVILNLNKDQMLLGRNREGGEFAPNYLNDSYFKTKEQAEAYAAMKKRLEIEHRARITYPLNYSKDELTPNLIVTGPFQDSMFIEVGATNFLIGSRYKDAEAINQKYEGKVFGLAPLSVEYFWLNFLRSALKKHLKYFGS